MKRIIAILLAAVLCVGIAGCSKKDDQSASDTQSESVAAGADTSETSADKPHTADVSGTKMYSSIEEFIDTDEISSSLESAKESGEDVVTFDYHAEDNALVYDYTYTQYYGDSEIKVIKESLEKSLDDNADYYSQVADVLRKNVKVDDPQVVINYHNNDGSIIVSRTFE